MEQSRNDHKPRLDTIRSFSTSVQCRPAIRCNRYHHIFRHPRLLEAGDLTWPGLRLLCRAIRCISYELTYAILPSLAEHWCANIAGGSKLLPPGLNDRFRIPTFTFNTELDGGVPKNEFTLLM